jgi:hypothetical protein
MYIHAVAAEKYFENILCLRMGTGFIVAIANYISLKIKPSETTASISVNHAPYPLTTSGKA